MSAKRIPDKVVIKDEIEVTLRILDPASVPFIPVQPRAEGFYFSNQRLYRSFNSKKTNKKNPDKK